LLALKAIAWNRDCKAEWQHDCMAESLTLATPKHSLCASYGNLLKSREQAPEKTTMENS